MGNFISSLRKLKVVDWLLKSLEAYTSLAQQYVASAIVKSGISAVLGAWTWFTESWVPMSLMVAVGTYVILSYLPHPKGQTEAGPSRAEIQPGIAAPNLHLLNLTYAMVYQTTILLMDDILGKAPTGLSRLMPESNETLSESAADMNAFIATVRKELEFKSDRWERHDFEMKRAEQSADQRIEGTPTSDRPSGIDPLLMRKWAIANAQYVRSIAFLKSEKADAARDLLNHRPKLLDGCQDFREAITRK